MLVKTEKINLSRFLNPDIYQIFCSIFMTYIRIIFTVLILILGDEVEWMLIITCIFLEYILCCG